MEAAQQPPSRTRLSDVKAQRAAPEPGKVAKGNDTFVWDDALPGFGLKITAAGGRSWVFQYRTRDEAKQTRRMTLGTAGKGGGAISASRARDLAEQASTRVKAGQDPQADKIAKRNAATVGELLDLWLAHQRSRVALGDLAESTRADYATRANGHLRAAFGSLKPADLTRQRIDVWRRARLDAAAKTAEEAARVAERPEDAQPRQGRRTAKAKPAPRLLGQEGMKAVLRVLSAFCGWAVDHGHMSVNPALGMGQFATARREVFLSPAAITAAGASIARSGANEVSLAALRALILSGMRRGEVLAMRWEHVDLDARMIELVQHKTSRKTGRRLVPITPSLAAVFEEAKAWRRRGCPYVFPAQADKAMAAVKGGQPVAAKVMAGHLSPTALRRAWAKVRGTAGVGAVRLHDLRHTAASVGAAEGLSLPQIGKVLGHTSAQTTARYAHMMTEAATLAAAKIAAPIAALLEAGANAAGQDAAKVAALPRPDPMRKGSARKTA
ncbi:site-specific integrase [Roseomonas sp. CAU 1739]|uniref:site-specific integrase n=1 Tax=Roseomonas sp. CAU 1739 TaxID=3140364 RepID=UPI00325C30CA